MSVSVDRVKILEAAVEIRRLLEEHGQDTAGTCMELLQRFPRGSCDTASRLLARYLSDDGLASTSSLRFSVNGTRRKVHGVWTPARFLEDGAQTHAWIEIGGLIVDITADQFEDGPAAVLVTNDRSWHDLFAHQETRAYDVFMDFNEHYADDFEVVYSLLRGRTLGRSRRSTEDPPNSAEV